MWMSRLEEVLTKEQISSGKRLSKKAEIRVSAGCLRGKVSYASKPTSRVTLRFARLAAKARRTAAHYVGQDASLVARLMDGELPRELYEALKERDVDLIPPFLEALGDGECTWHARFYWTDNVDCRPPCQHQVATWYAAGLLIDSDPFLLLELLGIDRQSILEASRVAGTAAGARRDGIALSGDDLGRFWTWQYDPSIHAAEKGPGTSARKLVHALEALPPPDTSEPGRLFREHLIGLLKAMEAVSTASLPPAPAGDSHSPAD